MTGKHIIEKNLFKIKYAPGLNKVYYFKYDEVIVFESNKSLTEEYIKEYFTYEKLQSVISDIIQKTKFSPTKIAFAFRYLSNELECDRPSKRGNRKNIDLICECIASYIEKTPSLIMIQTEASQLRM
jgi:hypothetical protein